MTFAVKSFSYELEAAMLSDNLQIDKVIHRNSSGVITWRNKYNLIHIWLE